MGAGGGGNSCNVDLSCTIPGLGALDPYINDCPLILVNMDTGEEGAFTGWRGSFDGVIPPNLCSAGVYPGSGRPYGSFSVANFDCSIFAIGGFFVFVPLVTVDTSVRPDPPPPPQPIYKPRTSGGLSWTI